MGVELQNVVELKFGVCIRNVPTNLHFFMKKICINNENNGDNNTISRSEEFHFGGSYWW